MVIKNNYFRYLFYISCSYKITIISSLWERKYLAKLNHQSRAGAACFGPLEPLKKKDTRSRFEKKSGAGAAKKIARLLSPDHTHF